jgi:hypothetical protein
MDPSSQRLQDEERTMQRELYRPGQSQSADAPTVRVGAQEGKAKPASRRKRVLTALAVAAGMLMLGGISYWICLPDLDEVSRKLRAIREDPNLTPEQRLEKSREIYSKLTPSEGRQVFQNDFKKWHYEKNAEMQKFLKMSPGEQRAYVKKQDEERKQHRPQGGFVIGGGPRNGAVAVKSGGSGGAVVKGGGKPGGFIFYGPGPGGPGGGPPNPSQIQKNMLDNDSPETRAGMAYQRGLLK